MTWIRVEGGQTFCQRCNERVTVSWRFYVAATASTLCYCEACVEELLGAA